MPVLPRWLDDREALVSRQRRLRPLGFVCTAAAAITQSGTCVCYCLRRTRVVASQDPGAAMSAEATADQVVAVAQKYFQVTWRLSVLLSLSCLPSRGMHKPCVLNA